LCYLILITRTRDLIMVSPFHSDYSYVYGDDDKHAEAKRVG